MNDGYFIFFFLFFFFLVFFIVFIERICVYLGTSKYSKEFAELIIFKFVELLTRLLLFMQNKIKRELLAFVGRQKTRHVLRTLQMIAHFAGFFFFFFSHTWR